MAILVVSVFAMSASSFKAAANSLSVLRLLGAESTKAAVAGSCHYVSGFTVSVSKYANQVMQDASSSYSGDNTGTSEYGTYYGKWELKDGSSVIQAGYFFNPCNFNFDFATPITITKGNATSIGIINDYNQSGEYAIVTLRGFTVAE